MKKKKNYSPQKKRVKQKNNKHEFPSKVCFETFSEKREENELHRKYMLLGGPVEKLSSHTISQI